MVAALSLASGKAPLVVGKPERNMMDIITQKYAVLLINMVGSWPY